MMRDKRKCASADERQRAIFRLGDLIEEASELLWASIVWGEGYPELCDFLDGLVEEVAEEIRVLGRWMLRRGIDPPISRLCPSSRRRENSVDGVIRSLLTKEEAALIRLRYISELSQQKTAEILKTTQVGVSRKERKILQKLREILKEE